MKHMQIMNKTYSNRTVPVLSVCIILGAILIAMSPAPRPALSGKTSEWSEITEVTRATPNAASECPQLCVYNNRLQAVWQSTTETGRDIVLASFDGRRWSSGTSITSYSGGDNIRPTAVVFNGELYVVWQRRGDTTGTGDYDIVYRSYNGTAWSETAKVTVIDEGEDDTAPRTVVYGGRLYVFWYNSTHLQYRWFDGHTWRDGVAVLGKGWGFDVLVYDDQLFVAWTTTDVTMSAGEDADIVLRCFDGTAWSALLELTPEDNGLDYAPALGVYQDNLYVAWVTTDKNISTGPGNDDDIVIRRYDASMGAIHSPDAWSRVVELTPQDDGKWDGWPQLTAYHDGLFVAWQTWDLVRERTTETGDDIVLRRFDGSRATWSKMAELTPAYDYDQDGGLYGAGMRLMVFDDKLYVIWQHKLDKKYGTEWNILWKSYDDNITRTAMRVEPTTYLGIAMVIISTTGLVYKSIKHFALRKTFAGTRTHPKRQLENTKKGHK